MLVAAGCQKDVSNRTANLPALQQRQSDSECRQLENRFTFPARQFYRWPPPFPPAHPLYAADLFEIKALQKESDQRIRKIPLSTGQQAVY